MIEAYLLTPTGLRKPIRSIGGAIVIRHDAMDMGVDDQVATHKPHSWEMGGDRFILMKVNSPVHARLERGDEKRELGRFGQLWLVDGMILNDLDQEQPLASFQVHSKLWLCHKGRESWESVVFTEL